MKRSITAMLFALYAVSLTAGSVTITAFPVDSYLTVMEGDGKKAGAQLGRDNAPIFLKDVKGKITVCGSERGYELKRCPSFDAAGALYVELKPVTTAAAAMLEKGKNNMDELASYPEQFPMLTDAKYYGYLQAAMESDAKKQGNFSPANIGFDVIYKDTKNGVYAAAYSVMTARAGGAKSPIAPSSPEESSEKNQLKLFITGADGKLKYIYTHNCAKFISLKAVYNAKKGRTEVTEEYSSMQIVKPGVEFVVKAEYNVDALTGKISYNSFTYSVKDAPGIKPVVKKVTAVAK